MWLLADSVKLGIVLSLPRCATLIGCSALGVFASQQDAITLNNEGVQLRLASRPADAILKFNAAIEIARNSGDDRLLAAALGGLGSSLVDEGEISRAQPVLRRSLALFEKSTGPDSLECGEAANNLAMVYRKSGDLNHAQELLERALPLMQKFLDPHSQELEIAFNNMFIVLAEQKKWDQGEPYLRQALEISAALPENAAGADVEENLALLESHRGQLHDAVETMQRVIAILEKTLGPANARLAEPLESYAACLRKNSQKAEADQAERRARTIRRAGL